MNKILFYIIIASLFSFQSVLASNIVSIDSGSWDNPSIWNSSIVPNDGDTVTISSGNVIDYNINNTTLNINVINIDGTLSFSRSVNTALSVGVILVRNGGYLDIGNITSPIPSGVKTDLILYHSQQSGVNPMISINPGGKWTSHGAPMKYTWTTLSQDIHPADRILNVDDSVDWNIGDSIVIGSSDINQTHFEVKTISSVSGKQIIIPDNIAFEHTGNYPEKTEIINLNRNVVIRSGNTTLGNGTARAHTIFLEGSVGDLRFTRFDSLGPRRLGEYPIHFHIGKTSLVDSVVYGNSITNSDNRCLTIHSTVGINVTNNVAFNASGHCYFLESGDEYGNTLDHNVGIYNKVGSLLTSDTSGGNGPSIFWIQNGNNTIINNIASSGTAHGFWYQIPDGGVIFFDGVNRSTKGVNITKFDNDNAHSNLRDGLFVEPAYQPVFAEFTNFIAWRNKERGIWGRLSGNNITFKNEVIFGNSIGATFPARPIQLKDSVFFGEVDRVFNQNKQTLYPNAYKGFEFYDGPIYVTNITAKNHFSDTASYFAAPSSREHIASDVGMKEVDKFTLDSNNTLRNSVLLSPIPIYFQNPVMSGEASSIINVSNVSSLAPQQFCLVATKFNYDPTNCFYNSTFNAYVCTESCESLKTIKFESTPINLSNFLKYYVIAVRKDLNETRILNTTTFNTAADNGKFWLQLTKNKTYDFVLQILNGTINNVTNLSLNNYTFGIASKTDLITNYTEYTDPQFNKTTFIVKEFKNIALTAPKKPVNVTYAGIFLNETMDTLNPQNNTWYYNRSSKELYIYINR